MSNTKALPTIDPQASPLFTPALTAGFGATLAMWIIWWITHLPGMSTPAPIALILLSLTLIAGLTAFARLSQSPLRTGLVGGVVAGVLNLLILGSVLSVQAENTAQMNEAANRFHDNALTMTIGYIALTMFAGLVAGLVGKATRSAHPAGDTGVWLARFSVVTVFAFLPLILVGGAVTGTESGMSVPDGVTSYGAFSAMLPMSIMAEPRIFLEHTHRLFGTLVGLTAIVLMISTLIHEKRLAPRIFSVILLLLVITQGVFGALRVGASIGALAAVHGVFAQMTLAFAVVTACKLSGLDRHPPTDYDQRTIAATRKSERMTHVSAWALLIQLIFGALARHSETSSHAKWTHVGFSIVVVGVIVIASAILRTADDFSPSGRLLRRIGRFLTIGVFVQFLLGGLTLWQVGMGGGGGGGETRPIPTADELAGAHDIDILEALITTAHQTIGATLFGLTAMGVYWSKRIRKHAQKIARDGR